MSDLPSQIKEIIWCKICFHEYTTNNLPKMLTCCHTFCHNCIEDFISSNKAKNKFKFPCPLCRKETHVEGGVKNLPNNYTVLALMDMVGGTPDDNSEDGAMHDCRQPKDDLPMLAHNTKSSPNTGRQTETKCCRCGKCTGVIPIKCGHKICKDCKKREKKMEVSSIPCQICFNVQNGIDYYTEENPPPFCDHTHNLRPPPANPNYSNVTSEYAFDSDFVYPATEAYPKEIGLRPVEYLADNTHTHHASQTLDMAPVGYSTDRACGMECSYSANYTDDSHLGQRGYQPNGTQVVYSQNSGRNSSYSQDNQIASLAGYTQAAIPVTHSGYTQNSSQAATNNLCQEFVSHVNIDEGYHQYPQSLSYGQTRTNYIQASTQEGAQSLVQASPAPYQADPSAIQARQYQQHALLSQSVSNSPQGADPGPIPYQEDDPAPHLATPPGGQITPPRTNSPPPAYSEIDQHPQPTVSSQSSPAQRRRPKSTKTTSKTDQTANTTKSAQSKSKAKGQSSHKGKVSPPSTQPVRGGVAVLPVAIQQQTRPRSTPEAGTTEETLIEVFDHNGESTKDLVRTTIPSGSRQNVAKQPVGAAPVTPKRQAPPTPITGEAQRVPETLPNDGQVPVPKAGPIAPLRRLAGEPQGLPFKCVKKFGRYSESKMQSSCFQKPTRISLSTDGQHTLVTDTQEMTIQIFTNDGKYVNKFKVLGVEGACLWAKDNIAVATNRGVEFYTMNGHLELELSIGPCVNTVPYKDGFIVIRQKSLLFFNASIKQTRELLKKQMKVGPFKKHPTFENIKDVAMSMDKDIAVLESSGEVFVMDEEGNVKYIVQPQNETCGKIIDPFSITYDRWSNMFITDVSARKVLRFTPNGKFSRCVLDFSLGEASKNVRELRAYGLAASAEGDHLLTVICGDKCAEIRIYKLY